MGIVKYLRVNWQNKRSGGTPLSAANLNVMDKGIADCASAINDTKGSVVTYTSTDVADGAATSWTTVAKLTSGETHASILAKLSNMFKNVRFLYKMLGKTNISAIGDGTVLGALSALKGECTKLNDNLVKMSIFNLGNITLTASNRTVQKTLTVPDYKSFIATLISNGVSNNYNNKIVLSNIKYSGNTIWLTFYGDVDDYTDVQIGFFYT